MLYYQSLLLDSYENFSLDDYLSFRLENTTIFSYGVIVPTLSPSVYSKNIIGSNDVSISGGCYKFMGCSLLSVNMTLGYNGTASSMSMTLVEDGDNNDLFLQPTMPSLWAFALPSGGVGAPIFYPDNYNLQPSGSYNATPFYFAGLCNQWGVVREDVNGRIINLSLVDPREVLGGVQCLLGNFALGQNFAGGLPRYDGVTNVIDIFGYYNYGFESNRNLYGIEWSKIRTVIESTRVGINGINFEFLFSGDAFDNVPSFYRMEDNIIDLMALSQKICQDAGADLILRAIKADVNTALVEIIGIKRSNGDPLTQFDISNFSMARSGIVESVKLGKEYRNEPTSNIVVGGYRNANYVAYPTSYDASMHLTAGKEDYAKFPADIKSRLFGGTTSYITSPSDGSPVSTTSVTYTPSVGSIFPFWGFASLSGQDPMAEPFLPLEHLVFDRNTTQYSHIASGIPLCRVDLQFLPVRTVPHTDMFLDGDGDADYRPFGVVSDVKLGYSGSALSGYMRGLPLNTEVLRAALVSEELFYTVYSMYYPEVSKSLKMKSADWYPLYRKRLLENSATSGHGSVAVNVEDEDPIPYMFSTIDALSVANAIESSLDANGRIPKSSILSNATSRADLIDYSYDALISFNSIIYEQVRQYANDYCGKRFAVCLPQSVIMQRIWNDLPVPTRVEKPEIEYILDDSGYWENVPIEFDGIGNYGASGSLTGDQEGQIVRRFSSIDGRYSAMIAMDWRPSGNVCFNSNSLTRAMFQDLPVSEFRPNQIATGNPSYVFISTGTQQLVKRPDIALVDLPCPIAYDPIDTLGGIDGYISPSGNGSEFAINRLGIIKFLQSQIKTNNDLRSTIKDDATVRGLTFGTVSSNVVNSWSKKIYNTYEDVWRYDLSYERVMDLKAVVLPLTSTWVRYGPWYSTSGISPGMVKFDIDDSLVPWNFTRPPVNQSWDTNLNAAGNEKLNRSIAVVDYLDNATITVAGFPEVGIGEPLGFNSNITAISVDFGIGKVSSTYVLSTYAQRPGTYRKSDYDNVSRARIENRPRIVDPNNENLFVQYINPLSINRFPS